MKDTVDHVEHTSLIIQDVVVPETQNAKASAAEKGIPFTVGKAISVLRAIRLDDQPSFETSQVDNIGFDDMLPPEFGAGHATVSNH